MLIYGTRCKKSDFYLAAITVSPKNSAKKLAFTNKVPVSMVVTSTPTINPAREEETLSVSRILSPCSLNKHFTINEEAMASLLQAPTSDKHAVTSLDEHPNTR
ncbi:unnamed protein product [Clavelina lepadiformis]|uniref:Uncharacterized protein n=1 Tax=Clavelina lepadiformis TaxID=159417 RepID=A0ABP0FJ57_CLALP